MNLLLFSLSPLHLALSLQHPNSHCIIFSFPLLGLHLNAFASHCVCQCVLCLPLFLSVCLVFSAYRVLIVGVAFSFFFIIYVAPPSSFTFSSLFAH